MNKKLLSILFTLFLAGILSVSCSNADKTGSGETKPTGIDSKYAGNWIGGGDLAGQTIVINADGSAKNQTEGVDMPASSITKNSDTSYTANYTLNPSTGVTVKGTMNIEFTTDTSANVKGQNIITDSYGTYPQNINGTLTKQQ
ncbi:hypothetical protein [uncultured Brachyspira sp.]|uniref:hypothetical protein n=1 Tax=uncultured Brachyspira sp. TaxID=221953 RepID=UPI00261536F3|nr:hypothetical protein [uncultured Brachyspira sp.]